MKIDWILIVSNVYHLKTYQFRCLAQWVCFKIPSCLRFWDLFMHSIKTISSNILLSIIYCINMKIVYLYHILLILFMHFENQIQSKLGRMVYNLHVLFNIFPWRHMYFCILKTLNTITVNRSRNKHHGQHCLCLKYMNSGHTDWLNSNIIDVCYRNATHKHAPAIYVSPPHMQCDESVPSKAIRH